MKKKTIIILCACLAIVLAGGFLVMNALHNAAEKPIEKPDINELDADELLGVKQAYLDMEKKQGRGGDMTTDDVRVLGYYGTYRGCIAVMLTDNKAFYTTEIWEESVAGVNFMYSNSNRIYVCKDGEMYTLEQAYEQRLLKKSDIQKICDARFLINAE